MTKKKEKWHPVIIGDVVEAQNCKVFGMSRNKYRGVVIWRPMDTGEYTPQFYAIWTWNKLNTNDKEANRQNIKRVYNRLDQTHYWNIAIWNYMLNENCVSHIVYVPVEYRENIQFLEHENPVISVGDIVLDRRWLARFRDNNLRRVLAVKKDKGYDEDRICFENPVAEKYLTVNNWVSVLLRRNVIKISKTKAMEMPEEAPEPKPNRLKNIIVRKNVV